VRPKPTAIAAPFNRGLSPINSPCSLIRLELEEAQEIGPSRLGQKGTPLPLCEKPP